jgi:DNA-binding GntR family transcriptional regulator
MSLQKTEQPEGPERSGDALGRTSLADRIYERLRLALMTGGYEPGQRLNIRQLAISYETSSTPVREATMQLAREGALELRPGHLLRVPDMTIEGYLEVRDIRLPLERLAAERAATRITPGELLELQYQSRRCVDAEAAGLWKEALAANQEFHFVVYRAARSAVLVRMIENMWLLTGPFINHLYASARPSYRSAEPHSRIIGALEKRDAAAAGNAVTHDITLGSTTLVEQINAYEAMRPPATTRRRAGRR